MPALIKNGAIVDGGWKILRIAANDSPHSIKLPVGPVLVPIAVWNARRAELIRREYEHGWPLGVLVGADESPAAIENDVDDFSVIAIEFDKTDSGNSYFTARLLREHCGYRGELRLVGDVPEDKLPHLQQLGFDAVTPPGRQLASGRFVTQAEAAAAL